MCGNKYLRKDCERNQMDCEVGEGGAALSWSS